MKASRTGVPDAWTVYDALGNRVATKINDVWQYVVYDAFGKCVAEYGQLTDGVGGVKYVQQDWQGSVRTVTNANGFVVARTDHQAFGGNVGSGTGQRAIEQGYNTDAATRQGYGLTERDEATGLDHTWFRKNESAAGRWTSLDPYKGSMNPGDPQSFNRYSYVQNQPTNFIDPSGLNLSVPDATYGGGILWTLWYGNNKDGWTLVGQWFEPYPVSGHEGLHSGGGGGDGGGSSGNDGVSERCKQVIKDFLGEEVLNMALALMTAPPLINLDRVLGKRGANWSYSVGDEAAQDYFGSLSGAGKTVSGAFDRLVNGQQALAIRGYGSDAIFFHSNITRFEGRANFLFHEVMHLVQPLFGQQGVDLDSDLASNLNIHREKGMSDSDLVSRFFNSGCNQKYGGVLE